MFQRRLEEAGGRTKAVYRYGLGFMCVGVVLNWLGFYESALHPVRYLGLAFVASGILLICIAVCKALGRNINDNPEVRSNTKKRSFQELRSHFHPYELYQEMGIHGP